MTYVGSPPFVPAQAPSAGADQITPLSPTELFDQASQLTGSNYSSALVNWDQSPADKVMSTVYGFGGDPNISDHERGVLLLYVKEMTADGNITNNEANSFANRVEAMTRDMENYHPTAR